MTTELIRFGFLGTVFGLVWVLGLFLLIWAYASKAQTPGKEMIVRYVFTTFLLLVLQIVALGILGIMFLLPLSRQSTHMEMTQQHHAVHPSN